MSTVNLGKQHPDLYKSMLAFNQQADAAVAASGLDPKLVKLGLRDGRIVVFR